ncbi:unnamed protein product, partial [Mesorhabditis belari]|uniref:C2H2-type domain-containing protein n=1 Tax=Mesorhabditis belari TaxID=2138241 RepID=A0AAF3EGG0_9BILA
MRTRRQSAIGGPTPANIDVEGGGEEEYTPPSGVRAKREVCPYGCQRLVAPRTIEIHRTQGCRGLHEEPFGEADRRRNYLCGVCCMEFHTRRGFMDHMNDEHDVAARIHVLDFPNREMFERFFHWLEVQGGANFRTRSGAKRQLTGKRAMMFRCNRTGYVESQSAAERRNREKLGPVRCGYSCTAYVQVTFHEEGHCTATFCGDHYGHDARLRVPLGVKHLIGRYVFDQDMNFGDIVRLLHYKFAPLCTENVLAQRIRMIDNDEIRTIVLALKRQIENGTPLPEAEDIWDEELLDKAQIDRPWITQRNLRPGDKTTEELARELDWPVPSVFVAKQKSADGEYRPVVHMLLGKEQRGDGEDAEDDEDSDHRIVSVEKSPSFQNPVDYHLIPVGETVEYETINVEEVEGGALRRGRPRGATQRATISPHRSNLTRILLSEANYIKTLVAANVTFQNDQELMRWIHKLREVRKELNDSSKREGHTMQTPADAYFDHLVHEDILRDERKRPYDTAFTPINGNTDLGIVSDDEELITQTTQGHIHYRPELWN